MELFRIQAVVNGERNKKYIAQLQQLLACEMTVELHKYTFDTAGEPLFELNLKNDNTIVCLPKLPQFQLIKHGPIIYKAAAAIVADFIVQHLESHMMEQMIARKYASYSKTDRASILQFSQIVLQGEDWDGYGAKFIEADQKRRKQVIATELFDYWSTDSLLLLEGFTTFRLAAYRQELNEVIEYALDEFVLEKQYKEFIDLLKYFVYLQDTKQEVVHLFHYSGQDFTLYDKNFEPITVEHNSDAIVAEMIETEMNMNDMVLSSLIAVSPAKIIVHTKVPQQQIIRTIASIFENRVTVCSQCAHCSKLATEGSQP
ncbi:sporulation protein YtxC [Paenibacillus yanchengensis]|uniref:Sporulation protein YtxC n=1 Tax=Paenibacillus yanchengensis TaxID=2035833 RepID=A0ABW4YPQ4_9BACL